MALSKMKNLSVKLLKPQHAILSAHGPAFSLTVLMHAFVLEGELVASVMQLDGIQLPSARLADLVGKAYDFPLNPDDGYIDGSIYLAHRHHPIDIKRLEFHANRQGGATLLLKGCYVFEYEAGVDLKNTDFIYHVPISSAILAVSD